MYIKYLVMILLLFFNIFVTFLMEMRDFFKNNKYLVVLWILCGTALILFSGHYANILIDFGREVYYPQRILEGKVLYKDLFNIYGPFSYMFNAVLYKLLGINLRTLYLAGITCSFLVVSGIYLIAKKFLSEFLSFSLCVFTITVGILTPVIFNFTFPYSWGMLYGLVSFLYSVLFILKFLEDENPKHLYIGTFLAGISLCSKYEFIFYATFVLVFVVKEILKNKKTGIIALSYFLSIPFISFCILFIQGLTIQDLVSSFNIIQAMAKSETLKYFYQNIGVYFHIKTLPFMLSQFIITAISFSCFIASAFLYKKNKSLSYMAAVISIIVCFSLTLYTERTTFFFLPVLIIILCLIYYRKLIEDKKLRILLISAITISLKFLWGLILLSYGTFFAPFLLLSFFALLFSYIPKEYQKAAGLYLLIVTAVFVIKNFDSYSDIQGKIHTERGSIYTNKNLEITSNALINFLKEETEETDRVVIFPEGMMINFLAERKGDDFYNSLIPLYVEVFGEDKIIEHFMETKPEYIIFNGENMSDYGFSYICNDYAVDFCYFVHSNYDRVAVIDKEYRFLIYKIK